MTLQELQAKLAELTSAAEAKRQLVTDSTSAADAKRIEAEHSEIIDQARAVREKIDIVTLAEEFDVRALGDEHIAAGSTLEQFRAALLARKAQQSDSDGPVLGHVRGGQDETETRRQAVIEGQMFRGSVRGVELSDAARAGGYHVMRFTNLARECLGWAGVATRGLTDMEVIERALHTSSDFPLILSGLANATLLQAYNHAPQTFRPWCRQISLDDFRELALVRLDAGGSLRKVNEHGEFKRGTLSESKEAVQLSTFGEVIGITRQALVNDNLGALTQIPDMLGRRALQTESDAVYRILLSNPVMRTDNKSLFHADHANLGTAAALGAAELGKGRVAMSKQTGLDGKSVLGITPAFLLFPPELEMAAAQILAPINPAMTSNVVPEFIRNLTPVCEPRLSVGVPKTDGFEAAAGSATGYYLAASPAQVDTIVFAYLAGQSGPYIETRQGFDVDGMEIKIRHDFGAAPTDFRGLWKNAGAAL